MAERLFKRKRKPEKGRRWSFGSNAARNSKADKSQSPLSDRKSEYRTDFQKFGLLYDSGAAFVLDEEYLPATHVAPKRAKNDEDIYESNTSIVGHPESASISAAEDWQELLENPPLGEAIAIPLRQDLESKFKRDFGSVQIHDGADAQKLTEQFGTKAFAYRQHIWLSSSHDKSNVTVLAHELTHVVQQGFAAPLNFRATPPLQSAAVNDVDYNDRNVVEHSSSTSNSSQSLHSNTPHNNTRATAAHATTAAPVAATAGAGGAVQGFDLWDAAVSVGESIVDTAVDVVDYAGEVAGDLLDMGIDGARAIMRTVAPDFLEFFDNGGLTGMVNDIIIRAIDSLFSGVVDMIRRAIDVDAFASGFSEATSWFESFSGHVGEGICEWILDMASNVGDFFSETFQPVIDEISAVTCKVKGFFQGIWESIGAPIWDFLQEVGGEVWQEIQDLMSVVGELVDAGKDALGAIWDTAKGWFGIEAEEGEGEGGGIWSWISDIASDIGDSISEVIEPVMGPLRDAAGVLLLFVPGGQIIAVILLWPRLKQAFDWLTGVWEDLNLIPRAREFLTQTVFPFLMDAAEAIGQTFLTFADWLVAGVSNFLGIIRSIVSSIPSVLMPLKPVVDHVLALGQKVLGFARTGIRYVSRHFRSILRKLLEFIQLLGQVLVRLIAIVLNPFGLVGFLVGTIWRLLPDCIKGPLINFILDIIIGFVRLIPNNPLLGILWPLVKNALLGFLETVRELELERKVAISNKVANIIAGGSPSFFFGYLRGLIEGLWETITAPFQALAAVFELPTQIQEFLSNLGVRFCEILNQIRCFASQLVGRVFGSVDSVLNAISEFLSDPQRIISLIRCAIEGILSGARELGSQLAQHLIGVFEGPDEEIGRQAGRISAQVLIQAVIGFFTAGAGAAVSSGVTIVNRIASVLRTVGRAIRTAVRVIRGLFGRLVRFMRGLASRFGRAVVRGGRSVLGRLGGLFRRFTRWLARIGRRMFRGLRRRFGLSATQRRRWRQFNRDVSGMFSRHPRGVTKSTLRSEYGAIRRRYMDVAKWPSFITKHGARWRVWTRRVKSIRPRRAGSLSRRDVLMDSRSREIAAARAVRREARQLTRRETYISTHEVTSAINPIHREYDLESLRTRPVNHEQSFDVTIQTRKDETIPQKWPSRNEILSSRPGSSATALIVKIDPMTGASPYSDPVYDIKQHRRGNVNASTGNSLYIRGHIIHGSFAHGGQDNLTPLTRISNSTMRRTGESAALSAIRQQRRDRRSRNKATKAAASPIHYVVTTNRAVSGRPPKRYDGSRWRGCGWANERSLKSKVIMKVYKSRFSRNSWENRGTQIGGDHEAVNVPNNTHHTMHLGSKGRGYPKGWKEQGRNLKNCDE